MFHDKKSYFYIFQMSVFDGKENASPKKIIFFVVFIFNYTHIISYIQWFDEQKKLFKITKTKFVNEIRRSSTTITNHISQLQNLSALRKKTDGLMISIYTVNFIF